MIVLGLNFGHDAAAVIVRDGRVASYVLRERHNRVKHSVGLDLATIDRAISEAGCRPEQIEAVAMTSSQAVELSIDDPASFSISHELGADHQNPGELHAFTADGRFELSSVFQARMQSWLYELPADSWAGGMWRKLFPAYTEYSAETLPVVHPYLQHFVTLRDAWQGGTLEQLCAWPGYGEILGDGPAASPEPSRGLRGWFRVRGGADPLQPVSQRQGAPRVPALPPERVAQGFHFPVTVTLRGQAIPGYLLDHHLCHAASVYYQSGLSEAAILSHDGAGDPEGFTTGGFYYGSGSKLWPLTPHYLVMGDLYHNVGRELGLGGMGAPGRLMGLAAYGRPRFFDPTFVGNHFDVVAATGDPSPLRAWLRHCRDVAQTMGYDLAPLGDRDQALAPINVDIAASTQKLFEETMLRAAEVLWRVLAASGRNVPDLCLSGGTALNCPANTRIWREGRFANVHPEPSCDDGGLATGAAMWLHHGILDGPRCEPEAPPGDFRVYLGPRSSLAAGVEFENLEQRFPELEVRHPDDPGAAAAALLEADGVIGWAEGPSELGPRALGHRSLLCDPRKQANWERLNRIKEREGWRPFAPMVLEEEFERWFRNAPSHSPHMLFNADVGSSEVPAVTHVDGTARVQTVTEADGLFYRVLREFGRRTGVPILLNTSFNGPGEPIVETGEDAIRFLLHTDLSALFIDGVELRRRR